jgi:hypothetical protein
MRQIASTIIELFQIITLRQIYCRRVIIGVPIIFFEYGPIHINGLYYNKFATDNKEIVTSDTHVYSKECPFCPDIIGCCFRNYLTSKEL